MKLPPEFSALRQRGEYGRGTCARKLSSFTYAGIGNASQQSAFRERQAVVVADDQVVEHADVHQRQRVAQPPRDQFIRLAGLGNSRRMVVREDQRGGIVLQRLPHDLPRVNAGALCANEGRCNYSGDIRHYFS